MATDAAPTENNERTEWADGLRALADFVEEHPDFPLPKAYATVYVWGENPGATLAKLISTLGSVTKAADSSWIGVERQFGPITLDVKVFRDSVCERVVVGTKTETYLVPPEGVEMQEKIRTVELVEWVCPPSLLALAETEVT